MRNFKTTILPQAKRNLNAELKHSSGKSSSNVFVSIEIAQLIWRYFCSNYF